MIGGLLLLAAAMTYLGMLVWIDPAGVRKGDS